MNTVLGESLLTLPGQTVTVSSADSGRVIALRVGDRLVIDAPVVTDVTWRLRGAAPVLETAHPGVNEPNVVLQAARTGRTGVDLIASGSAMPLPRPIRLIVTVS